MRSSRQVAAACAVTGLLAAGLAGTTGPSTASGPRPPVTVTLSPASAAAPVMLRADRDAVVAAKRAKKRTSVSGWTSGTYRSSTAAKRWTFTVRVNGPKQRRVQLQQRVGTTWRTVAVGRSGSSRARAFTLRISPPAGTTSLRLRFPATKTHRAAASATKTFRVAGPVVPPPVTPPPTDPQPPVTPPPLPAPPPASTHYSFIDTDAIAAPALRPRWNRCTAIRWGADLTRATAGNGLDRTAEKARWDAVFAEVTAITGYTFRYVSLADGAGTVAADGDVTGYFADTGPFVGRDLILTYASPDDPGGYRADGLSGNVIGYGGPLYTYSSETGPKHIQRGQVLIDYGDVINLSLDTDDLHGLYLHELGHALGLGHYDDELQVMNPFLSDPAITAYADGDRNGLFRLASQACFTGAGLATERAALLR